MKQQYKVVYRTKGTHPDVDGAYIFEASSEKDARAQWNKMKKTATLMFTNCKIAWVDLLNEELK